eukprot:scaffold20736_cov30-Tisochrysis_lutea.AAC.1
MCTRIIRTGHMSQTSDFTYRTILNTTSGTYQDAPGQHELRQRATGRGGSILMELFITTMRRTYTRKVIRR